MEQERPWCQAARRACVSWIFSKDFGSASRLVVSVALMSLGQLAGLPLVYSQAVKRSSSCRRRAGRARAENAGAWSDLRVRRPLKTLHQD